MSEDKDYYNRGGMLAFAFSMVFVFAFFFYLVVVNKGVDLGENVVDPNAQTANVVVAFDIASVKEPWVSTPELVAYGKKVFMTNCAMCHGNEGKGDGVAGVNLNPKPRNFVEGQWKKGPGITDHFKVLQVGIEGGSMASYAHFKAADRWALLQFIDSITTNKSKEDPAKVAEFAKTAQ